MDLSPEQKILITRRAAADSPSFAAAYSLWLLFGLFGAHRFYLRRKASGAFIAAAAFAAIILLGLGIAWGGTPLDGLFYQLGIEDVLRATETWRGIVMFCAGLALLAGIGLWWLTDIHFIYRNIVENRITKTKEIYSFYQAY